MLFKIRKVLISHYEYTYIKEVKNMAIPKAPVKRTIQEAGAERVSADAVDALTEHIEEYM